MRQSCGTKRELAEIVGISFQSLGNIINGLRNGRPKTAPVLAKTLGTGPGLWLEGGTTVDRQAAFEAWSEARQSPERKKREQKFKEKPGSLPLPPMPRGMMSKFALKVGVSSNVIGTVLRGKSNFLVENAERAALLTESEVGIWQVGGSILARQEAFLAWVEKNKPVPPGPAPADVNAYGFCERMRARMRWVDCQNYRQPNKLTQAFKPWRENSRCENCAGLNMNI